MAEAKGLLVRCQTSYAQDCSYVGRAIRPTTVEIEVSTDTFVRWFGLCHAIAFFAQVAAVSGHAVAFLPLVLRQRTRTLFSFQGTGTSVSWLSRLLLNIHAVSIQRLSTACGPLSFLEVQASAV